MLSQEPHIDRVVVLPVVQVLLEVAVRVLQQNRHIHLVQEVVALARQEVATGLHQVLPEVQEVATDLQVQVADQVAQVAAAVLRVRVQAQGLQEDDNIYWIVKIK